MLREETETNIYEVIEERTRIDIDAPRGDINGDCTALTCPMIRY